MNVRTNTMMQTRCKLLAAFVPLLAALLFAGAAQAQWPLAIGGADDDQVVVSKVSPTGDVFVAGHFTGSLETSTGLLISNGLQDIFVARISPAGQLVWAVSAGGELTDVVNDLALDSAGNVYVAGSFFTTAQFGGADISAHSNDETNDETDGYLAKVNAAGDWQWARAMGGRLDPIRPLL